MRLRSTDTSATSWTFGTDPSRLGGTKGGAKASALAAATRRHRRRWDPDLLPRRLALRGVSNSGADWPPPTTNSPSCTAPPTFYTPGPRIYQTRASCLDVERRLVRAPRPCSAG